MSKGKQATIDKVAEVRALLVQGYTSPKVEALTGIPESTVRMWRASMTDLSAEQEQAIAARSVEIIALADTVQEMGLTYLIEQGPEAAAKALIAANAIRGTHTDKLQRRGDRNINIGVFNVQESRKELDAAIPGEYEVKD